LGTISLIKIVGAAYFRAVWPAIRKRIGVFQRKGLLAKTR